VTPNFFFLPILFSGYLCSQACGQADLTVGLHAGAASVTLTGNVALREREPMSEAEVPDTGPAAEYTRRLQGRRQEQAAASSRFAGLWRRRNVVVGLVIALAVLVDKESASAKVVLLGLPGLVVVGLILRKVRAAAAWRRATVAASYYARRLAGALDRWAGTGEPGTGYLDEGHPCALDLDLFGVGSLYERLCTAGTAPGRDTLAAWLLAPAPAEEVRQRQPAVAELSRLLDLREALALLASEIPAGERFAELTAWGQAPAQLTSPVVRALVIGSGALTLAALAGCFLGAGGWPLIVALLLQGTLAQALRRQVEPVLGTLEGRERTLRSLAAMLARLEAEPFTSARLRQRQEELAAGGRPASDRLRRLARRIAWWPWATLLGWRPQLALAVETWRRAFGPELIRWLAVLGEAEALCSLAAYAYENPDDPFPELLGEGPAFEAEGLGHPLLPRLRCVPNDLSLGPGPRLLIVSGSNMSGKSTLLRTVGVNAVLALTGAPVRARRLRLSALRVGATLRVQDSLGAGRSRFYAEALRVRLLLDLARGPVALLFLLDELFAGTGSHDRRAGAEAVVRRLLEHGAVGLVTTHDLAVTEIADRLAPRAVNVHFEDHTDGDRMAFDYRLQPGVARGSNGLALLRAVGIEV
jgi:hypothetical protein